MSGSIKVILNKAKTLARLQKACATGTEILANEMLKQSNYYAREYSGELIRSGIRSSEPKKGILRWTVPYARRVYYTGTPSGMPNPNASLMWAHKAKKLHLKDMLKKVADEVKREG